MAMNNNILEITPKQYYFETLRPLLIDMQGKIKFDDVMVKTIEEVLNKSDASATHEDYQELQNNINPFVVVLLDSKTGYFKTKDYMSSTQEEKDLVLKLQDYVQQLLTIIKCTPSSESKEEKSNIKSRLGYDETKGENILSKGE